MLTSGPHCIGLGALIQNLGCVNQLYEQLSATPPPPQMTGLAEQGSESQRRPLVHRQLLKGQGHRYLLPEAGALFRESWRKGRQLATPEHDFSINRIISDNYTHY